MKHKTDYKNITLPGNFWCKENLNSKSVKVAYSTYGKLNKNADNVILLCHALTGNQHAAGLVDENELKASEANEFLHKYNKMFFGKEGWWNPLIGSGKALDTDNYFIICPNVLGSCYGTDANTEGHCVREFTVRQVVTLHKLLLEELAIKSVNTVIGGSLGGMQTFEWGVMFGDITKQIIPIAAPVAHSPWAIGFNEAQRNAIMTDPVWNNGNYTEQPNAGLSTARKVAMLTYRTYESFQAKFGRKLQYENGAENNLFQVESYLHYQGEKIVKRFDANTYITLSKMMDTHDIGNGRGGIEQVLKFIKPETVVIGIDSDVLYPVTEIQEIVNMIPKCAYEEIKSPHGHDAFLIEFEQLDKILRKYL